MSFSECSNHLNYTLALRINNVPGHFSSHTHTHTHIHIRSTVSHNGLPCFKNPKLLCGHDVQNFYHFVHSLETNYRENVIHFLCNVFSYILIVSQDPYHKVPEMGCLKHYSFSHPPCSWVSEIKSCFLLGPLSLIVDAVFPLYSHMIFPLCLAGLFL